LLKLAKSKATAILTSVLKPLQPECCNIYHVEVWYSWWV